MDPYDLRRQVQAAKRAGPDEQPTVADEDLAVACEMWQGGRDSGSSRLRGAARVLTGAHHYFSAFFITEHEFAARKQREALEAAITLLRAVNAAPRLDGNGWNARIGITPRGFAGRGISSKPDQDSQIAEHLRMGRIEMPLWGVSLDPVIAGSFGSRFLLELVGDFPAVPVWVASGIKAAEQELVTGGRYRVVSLEQRGETTHVRLRWIGPSGDRVGSDPFLLDVLGTLPGVRQSSLTRYVGHEVLKVQLEGYGNVALVSHAPGSDNAEIERVPKSELGWDARGERQTPNASTRAGFRRIIVSADVASTVAAVLAGRSADEDEDEHEDEHEHEDGDGDNL